MDEILTRIWENLIGRTSGPLNFRLIMQPIMASFFAIRSGLKDAREGNVPFFWAVFFNATHRRKLLHHGWKDVGKIFILAVVLDVIYQIIVFKKVYVLESMITAIILAIVPYILLRGPINRLARLFTNKTPLKADSQENQNQKERKTI